MRLPTSVTFDDGKTGDVTLQTLKGQHEITMQLYSTQVNHRER